VGTRSLRGGQNTKNDIFASSDNKASVVSKLDGATEDAPYF